MMFRKNRKFLTQQYTLLCLPFFIAVFLLTITTQAVASTQVTMDSINDWGTGFQGQVTISNTGSSEINGWTLSFDADFEIEQIWNAKITSHNGTQYIVESVGYNDVIASNASTDFGFIATPGSSSMPVVFIVNGEEANSNSETTPTPTPTPTSTSDSDLDSIAGYAYCSSEGETCTYSGTVDIAYGADGQFNFLPNQSSGSVSCDNDTFGDPVFGTLKACYIKSVSTDTDTDNNSDTGADTGDDPENNTGVTSLKSLADFPIGVSVNAGNENNSFLNSSTSEQQQSVVLPHFDQLTAGNIMKMSYLHPSEDTFTFSQADELVSFAQSNGMGIHGHTLIWHSDYQVPDFMKSYDGDFAAMLKEHIQTIVSHFAGKVASWDVVNEALADDDGVDGFRNSVFYQGMGVNYIDQAFINARAADPDADLFYNDYSIENGGTKTDNMLSLVDGLMARDVPITGVGFQMHVLLDWPDVSVIEQAMVNVADRGLKVKITELDVRVNNPYNSSATVYTSLTDEAAARQKERYYQIVAAYLRAVPASLRAGITVWGVWDADSWLNTADSPDWPLLFDDNFQAKPALQGFADGLTSQ
jgi:endo-1,4-beta-xylanase